MIPPDLLLIGFLVLAHPAPAHHSQVAAFDMDRDVEIEGVVRSFIFRNPHPVLSVQVVDEDGDSVVWEIEFAPMTVLAKRGWTLDHFVPGEVIAARGHPSRAPGTHGMAAGATITRADGTPVR